METVVFSKPEKQAALHALIDSLGDFDSISVILSRPNSPSDNVQGETRTFIYPNHLTSQINVMTDLLNNLKRIRDDPRKN